MQESAFRVTRGTDHGASAQGIRGWGRRSRHSVTAGELHDPQLHACVSDPAGSLTCSPRGSRPGVDGLQRDVSLGTPVDAGLAVEAYITSDGPCPDRAGAHFQVATRLSTGGRGMTLHSTHSDWLARHVPQLVTPGPPSSSSSRGFLILCLGPRVSGRTPARPSRNIFMLSFGCR